MDKHQLLFKVSRSMLHIQVSQLAGSDWFYTQAHLEGTKLIKAFSILSKENPDAALQFLLLSSNICKIALSKSMMEDEHRIIPTERFYHTLGPLRKKLPQSVIFQMVIQPCILQILCLQNEGWEKIQISSRSFSGHFNLLRESKPMLLL